MKFQNKAKPIKFSLLVGGRECRSVDDVQRNFDLGSLCKNFDNGNLQKWLKQIGESSLLNRIDALSSADLLTKKVCLCHLFSSESLPSGEVNEDNVLKLLKKGCLNFGDLSDTPFADNIEFKKAVIENIDNATINRWCENDLELLRFVYSKKTYTSPDFLNATNCRTLIDQKIVTNEDVIKKIALKMDFHDILVRFGIVKLGNVAIEMVLVKGFSHGDFFIGKYPVTQAQWQAVVGKNPSDFKGNNKPVESVSWNDCNAFIKKLKSETKCKFRMPTVAEWKFAARGGNKTKGYQYSGSNKIDEVAWYGDNSDRETHPVGQKMPNELGIYDMSGNVWEWCDDFYEKTNVKHMLCGGAWTSNDSSCSVDSNGPGIADSEHNYYGLRLAMDV